MRYSPQWSTLRTSLMFSTSTPVFRLSMASKWEELLAEMHEAHEHGVPGIGAGEIAAL